jgi:hypothetical protein
MEDKMSRTFGHTKHNHPGSCSYRSAKKYKTDYSRALRSHHRDLIHVAEKDPDGAVDINLTKVEEIRERVNHPGDLW